MIDNKDLFKKALDGGNTIKVYWSKVDKSDLTEYKYVDGYLYFCHYFLDGEIGNEEMASTSEWIDSLTQYHTFKVVSEDESIICEFLSKKELESI